MVYYIIVLTTLKEDMSNKISELTNNEVPINFESNVITFYYLIHRIKDLLIKRWIINCVEYNNIFKNHIYVFLI